MVAGIVEHEQHPSSAGLLAQQSLEETLERRGVEDRAHHAHELAAVQTDGAEASHGLSGRRMAQDRVLDLRRYPHSATRAMLLEVTFIQAPQFDVGAVSQTTEFFLLPQLSADPIERLAGAACVAGTPFVEIIADTDVPLSPRRIDGADAPTRPDRPTALPADRSRAGFYVDRLATNAIASRQGYAVVPHAHPRASRPGRPPRNGAPSAAPWFRPHRINRRPRGTIDRRSPAATRAGDGRNATLRSVRSLAESRFALSRHPRSAACASSFSQRIERADDITMLHYLCRRV